MKLLIFFISFLILAKFKIDPDLGWHLAIGRKFFESGQMIKGDEFSWTMSGYLWGNTYLLYQIIVAFIFENLSYLFAVLFFGFIGALSILFLLPKKVNLTCLLIAGLGAAIAIANLGIRPHTFSFLFFSILLFFLDRRYFEKPVYLLFAAPIFLLWGNIHRGFLIGLVVFAAFIVIDYFVSYFKGKTVDFRRRLLFFGVVAICSIFSASGLEGWKSGIIADAVSFENIKNIAEWQSTVLVFPLNIVFAVSGAIFIFILRFKSSNINFAWIFISSLIFAFSFVSVAFASFWSAIFIFMASRYLGVAIKLNFKDFSQIPLYFSLTAAIFALFLNLFVEIWERGNINRQILADKYPLGAIEHLKQTNALENVFNDYGWGGFIEWQMPSQKVFIDGRMASWRHSDGTSILTDYIAIRGGDCGAVSRYDIKSAIFPKDKNLECFEDWAVVYEDEIARVLIE